MLVVLSPAKNLTEPPASTELPSSELELWSDTERLLTTTKRLSAKKIKGLMGLSDKLAELNYQRFQVIGQPFEPGNSRQALLMFNGDVYRGLDAPSLSADDFAFAQDHVAILSGLYGVVRPLDLIQPYRLEMGTKLKTRRGPNLYKFWGSRLTKVLNAKVAEQEHSILVNLASNEYFKAAVPKDLKATVITPSFLNVKDGESRSLFYFIKLARGLMTRWIIQNRITEPARLKEFDLGGYSFDAVASTDTELVFSRPQPPPPKKR